MRGAVLHLRPAASAAGRRVSGLDGMGLAEFCGRWTPAWEAAAGGVYLDLSGTDRWLGAGADGAVQVCREARRCWGAVSGGLGQGVLVALLAARLASAAPGQLLLVPAGSEAVFLAPFAVDVLTGRFAREVVHLQRLGVRTLGDLQTAPRALLEATFGPVGADLAAAARGRLTGQLRPDRRRQPHESVVVRARWQRPLAGGPCERALQRAVARRALLACAGGPRRWRTWRLRGIWAGGAVAVATGPGRGDDSWDAWLALVEDLWRRWPHRRRGLVGLELRAGRPRRVEDQGSLFPDPAAAGRMRLTAGWRRLAGGDLRFASEAVLVDWGIRWDEALPPTEALVDACQADR